MPHNGACHYEGIASREGRRKKKIKGKKTTWLISIYCSKVLRTASHSLPAASQCTQEEAGRVNQEGNGSLTITKLVSGSRVHSLRRQRNMQNLCCRVVSARVGSREGGLHQDIAMPFLPSAPPCLRLSGAAQRLILIYQVSVSSLFPGDY